MWDVVCFPPVNPCSYPETVGLESNAITDKLANPDKCHCLNCFLYLLNYNLFLHIVQLPKYSVCPFSEEEKRRQQAKEPVNICPNCERADFGICIFAYTNSCEAQLP